MTATIAAAGAVHVGDVGTTYLATVQDAGAAFDLSGATLRALIFETPLGVLTREAVVTFDGTNWQMAYTLTSPVDDDFHAAPGVYRWQGQLGFADGERFHTNVKTYRVFPNLGG